MKVVNDFRGHYDDSIERHFNYEKYGDDSNSDVFLHGQGCIENSSEYKRQYEDYSLRVAFNYEQPCAWQDANASIEYLKNSADVGRAFHKIYTICPYSANWLNELQGENRFIASWVPYPEDKILATKTKKEYDVLYWGGLHHKNHLDFLDVSSKFQYNFITLGFNYWPLKDRQYAKYITKQNIPRKDLWDVIRKTKITLATNLLYLNDRQVAAVKKIKNWEKNECLSRVEENIIPQMKTRAIEATLNRSLLLIKKDPWNVIEKWYEPDKHFIYYEDKGDLEEKIHEISKNWEYYERIVEAAYEKSLNNYTTQHFFNMIKENK